MLDFELEGQRQGNTVLTIAFANTALLRASREFSIEKALDKMEADWEGLAFELGSWKATGTYILKGGQLAVSSCGLHSWADALAVGL